MRAGTISRGAARTPLRAAKTPYSTEPLPPNLLTTLASKTREDGAVPSVRDALLDGLTNDQKKAVKSAKRRVLIVAGAGSGKTEVMARRVAWWVAVDGVPKDNIVAFTFTERAAEEMKFRIRQQVQLVTPRGED